MSADFAKLKRYFVDGLWTAKQIGDAVSKGWITAEEYREITGEDYVSMPTQLDAIQAAVEKFIINQYCANNTGDEQLKRQDAFCKILLQAFKRSSNSL